MREGRVWGDDFADDGWQDLVSVSDWSLVTSDEIVRLFPALVPRGDKIPELVRNVVFARASDMDGSWAPDADERFVRHGKRASGTGKHDADCDNFARGALQDVSGRASRMNFASDAGFLRQVIHAGVRTRLEDGCEIDMARFAYLACVHPAYVWPAASAMPYWGTALAWLGALARCGRARMPAEVAEYFDDILIPGSDGSVVSRDPLVRDFMALSIDCAALRFSVRQRRGGVSVIVRGSRTASGERRLAPSLGRLFGRFGATLKSGAAIGSRQP